MTYILIFSIILNVVAVLYILYLLKKLLFVSDNIDDLLQSLSYFAEHLGSIYNLETFYGEPVLEKLVAHSRDIVDKIEEHHEVYSLTSIEDLTDEHEEED
jgi:hypothetical protein